MPRRIAAPGCIRTTCGADAFRTEIRLPLPRGGTWGATWGGAIEAVIGVASHSVEGQGDRVRRESETPPARSRRKPFRVGGASAVAPWREAEHPAEWVPATPDGFPFTSLLMLRTLRHGLWIVGALATFVASGQAQSTPERTRPHALRGVTWVGESTPRTILIQDGRIERVQPADQAIPESYTVLEAEGLVATASFLDAYSHSGSKTAEPVAEQDRPVDVGANVRTDMRPANRKGVQPSFQAAEASALDADASKAWSQSGFGVLLSAPHGELLAGTSVLLATRDAARRDQTVRANVFHHGAFQATGPGYPSTLMAYMAQLRQFFMDAQHQAELVARWEAGRPGPRPPHDPELEAALSLMDGTTLLVCEAETARDVHRWIGRAQDSGRPHPRLGRRGRRSA